MKKNFLNACLNKKQPVVISRRSSIRRLEVQVHHYMRKKSLPTILIILITLVLIAVIVWVFNNRIEQIRLEQIPDYYK